AQCRPSITMNMYTAANVAVSRTGEIPDTQVKKSARPWPTTTPNGPKTSAVSGTKTARATVGMRISWKFFGTIRFRPRSRYERASDARMAGNTDDGKLKTKRGNPKNDATSPV